ncbi:hypothetical protein SAMN04487948_101186 [Halogranum amylolyticum]|uniref:Uncharacterized protein n=1 Tax=Halogranum amylolyticum TaxID=660520 RepID=A0A1H8MYB8_9EURY|nr:hypothetical protein [Halogranum amylolyticum]SEO22385.1 hypothetical protein SAMN04487948_101186 [Halogranum amylolyticum]
MLRTLAALLGLVELLFPKQVVDVVTRLAYETPDEFEVKPWVYTAARVEGLVFLLLATGKLGSCADTDGDDVS